MKKQIKQVEEFYKATFQPVPQQLKHLQFERLQLRHNLMIEEVEETYIAARQSNMVEVADGLADQLYILLGTIIEFGLQDKIEEVFDEVHRANMSKMGNDGKAILREDGKILKGPNYKAPNLKPIISK